MVTKVKKKKDKNKPTKYQKMVQKKQDAELVKAVRDIRIEAKEETMRDFVCSLAWVLRLNGYGGKRIQRTIEDVFEMLSDIRMGYLLSVSDIINQVKEECNIDLGDVVWNCLDKHYKRKEAKEKAINGN